MTATIWVAVAQVANLACTGAALALAGLLLARRKRQVPAALAQTAALALTACWALSTFALGASTPASVVLFSASQLAWLWMLYGLFAHDERDKSVGQVRSLIVALGFVELLQLTLVPVSYGAVEETLAAITAFSRCCVCCSASAHWCWSTTFTRAHQRGLGRHCVGRLQRSG